MKRNLMDDLGIVLLRHAYTVRNMSSGAFDLVARKGSTILLIKVLEDANSISQTYADSMLRISSYIGAAPIIIARKAAQPLEDDVVYTRFGVYTLNFETFTAAMDNHMPFIISNKAGLMASIIGEKLKEKREELGLSLGETSRKIGVSKSMILKYESGQSDISILKAHSLHKIFGESVFARIPLFKEQARHHHVTTSKVAGKFEILGFDADDTKNAPFDVIAKKDQDIILTNLSDSINVHLQPLQKLIEAHRLTIYKKQKPRNEPALSEKEFLEYESAKELVKFIKEFSD